jgi:hypothetical protein
MTPAVKSFFRFFPRAIGERRGAELTNYYRYPRQGRTTLDIVATQMRGSVTPFCPWYLPPRSR